MLLIDLIAFLGIFLLLFNSVIFPLASCGEKFSHVVPLSDSILLEGHHGGDWVFNNSYLFIDKILMDSKFKESIFLQWNLSLYIDPVSLLHEGIYEVLGNFTTVCRHVIHVEGKKFSMCYT